MSSPFQPVLKTLAILQVKQDLLIEKGQEKPSHHLPCSCRVAMEILTVVLRISALNIDISRELPCVAEGGLRFWLHGYLNFFINLHRLNF